jgi:hypothetical protein
MPENQATPVAEVEAPVAVAATPAADKNEIYSRIAKVLNDKVDDRFKSVQERVKAQHKTEIHLRRVFGDEDGRSMLVMVFSELLDSLVAPGAGGVTEAATLGLPAGLGSIELLTAGATTKKTPQGSTINVPKRWRIKWNTGKAVSERLAALPAPAPDPEQPAPTATPA